MSTTHSPSHEDISRRAYELWEKAGRPEDDGTDHWIRAEAELHDRLALAAEAARAHGKPVEPPHPGKHLPDRAPHSADYAHPGVATDLAASSPQPLMGLPR